MTTVPLTAKSNIAIFLSSLGDSRTAELIENQEETPMDDYTEWSDVSSVTSCAWPASSLAESIASLDNKTEGNKNAIEIATYAEIADNPVWDDEYQDTRLIHARAGHTKHAKKSQRRYRNLGLPSNIDDAFRHEQVIERKPWKINHFPGYLPEKICQYRLEKLEGRARRALEDDVKMRDITPKPTKKGNWK